MPGLTIPRFERQSLVMLDCLRPVMVLPPNDLAFYVVGTPTTGFTVGTAATLVAGAATSSASTFRRGFGYPSSVHLTISTAGNYGGGDSITLEIVGLDEYYEVARERITLTNPATTVRTNGVFSRVDTITPTAKTFTGGSTASVAVGIGDSTATPNILFPHPLPGLPAGNVQFNTLVANPVLLVPSGLSGTTIDGVPGRYVVLNYAAVAMRSVGVTFLNVPDRSVLR